MKVVSAKVNFEINDWISFTKFPHVEPIVIVTSISKEGIADAAVKTWTTFINLKPSMMVFSCNRQHQTAKNILATKEFVVNIPCEDIVKETLATAKPYQPQINKIESAGLTAIPSVKVKPPRIKECKAHVECVLQWTKRYGDEIIIAGEVVSASADKDVMEASPEEKCNLLKPILWVGAERYAGIKQSRSFPK